MVARIGSVRLFGRAAGAFIAAIVATAAAPVSAAVTRLDVGSQVGATQTTATTVSGTKTISAGSNRLLLVTVYVKKSASDTTFSVTTATYGAQSLTQVQASNQISRDKVYIGYLNEAGITAAGASNTINITINAGTTTEWAVFAQTYSGVDQATPITASVQNFNDLNTTLAATFGSAIAVNGGGYTYYGLVTSSATGTRTLPASYVQNWSLVTANTSTWGDDKAAAATGTENPTINYTPAQRYALAAVTLNPASTSTLTIANASTGEAAQTIPPGNGEVVLDAFTLTASAGTATPSSVTVTMPAGSAVLISTLTLESASTCTGTVYSTITNPASDTPSFTTFTGLSIGTTATNLWVCVKPLSHAAMPVPRGSQVAVTGQITAVAATGYTQAGSDTVSPAVTIDNYSPATTTGVTGTAGNGQATLSWTANTETDLAQYVVLYNTVAFTDVPVEGTTTYVAGNTVGAAGTKVGCVAAAGTNTCITSPLTNGTAYQFKVFARDTYGNYSVAPASATSVTPTGPTLTIANASTGEAAQTIPPGNAKVVLDAFTLATSTSTATPSSATVTMPAGSAALIETLTLESASTCAGTIYSTITNPASDAPSFTTFTGLSIGTTASNMWVCVKPKTHANMPVPPGTQVAVTGQITAVAATGYTQAGSDTVSPAVTIDNLSPGDVTWGTVTAGAGQVTLNWTNPTDSDFAQVVVLRNTASIADVPVEGTTSYAVNNTIGTSTVACVVASPATTCTPTGLTNGTTYYFKAFSRDTAGNYAVGVQTSATPVSPAVTTGTVSVTAPTCQKAIVNAAFTSDSNNSSTITVARGTAAAGPFGTSVCSAAGGTANPRTCTDATTAATTTYYYQVTFADADGVSGTNPQVASVTTPVCGNTLTLTGGTQPAAGAPVAGGAPMAVGQLVLTASAGTITLSSIAVSNGAAAPVAVAGTDVASLTLSDATGVVATAVWNGAKYVFTPTKSGGGAYTVAAGTPVTLNVQLAAASTATNGNKFALTIAPADVVVVAPDITATTGGFTANTFTITTTGAVAEGAGAYGKSLPMVSILNPGKGTVVTGSFRLQIQAFSPTTNGVTDLTGLGYTTAGGSATCAAIDATLVKSTLYSGGTKGAIYEKTITGLAQGTYTIRACAANANGTVQSAPVSITARGAGTGDGNLLARDNASQLCTDCHALQTHNSQSMASGPGGLGSKYGSWSVNCRDCHTPHGSHNAYLIADSITPPAVNGQQGAKAVKFYAPTVGDSAAATSVSYVGSSNNGPCQVCHTRTSGNTKTGTGAFTAASGTVTASSAIFVSTDATRSLIGPDGKAYTISTYTSTTAVVISPVYAGTTTAAGAFQVGTARWRNTGNNDTHYAGATTQPCKNCHSHTGGFVASCTGCHGTPGRSTFAAETPPLDTCGNTSSSTNVGPGLNRVGAHQTHLLGNTLANAVACSQCHVDPPNRAGHPDATLCSTSTTTNRAQMTWGSLANGTLYGWSATVTPTYDNATQTCTNYCHGKFTNGNSTNAPTWGLTAACGTCHGTATNPQPGGTHPAVTAGQACNGCHPAGYNQVAGTACASNCVDLTYHMNGKMEVDCTGCHKTAQGTRRAIVPEFALTWSHKRSAAGAVTKWDCIVCHMEGDPTTGDRTAVHADGNINLRDPDTGANIKGVTFTAASGTSPGSFASTATDLTFTKFSRSLTVTLEADPNAATLEAIMINQCLKCHDADGAASTLARVPTTGTAEKPFGTTIAGAGYTGVGVTANGVTGGVVNVAASFATTNASYHPVMGKQNNSYVSAARMYAPWTGITKTGGNTTSWGYLISCWDCHASTAATGVQTSTVTAHGGAVTLRQNVWVDSATDNLCNVCHNVSVSSSNHGAGSAFASSGNSSMGTYLKQRCWYCHMSSTAKPARPVPAQDVHGFDAFTAAMGTDTLWPRGATNTYKPYAFMRNVGAATPYNWGTTANTGWKPLSGPAVPAGSATCGGTDLNVSGCTGENHSTYTPGGVY